MPVEGTSLHAAGTVALDVTDAPWAWAVENRELVAAEWARMRAVNPRLWNGGHLITTDVTLQAGHLLGVVRRTDFASFQVWRALGWPDRTAWNAFGACALHAADGALLVGMQAAWTANGGMVNMIGGSLEPADLDVTGAVDLDGSIRRELAEETGMNAVGLNFRPGWTVVFDGQRLACIRRANSTLSAPTLVARIRAYLVREERPELSDVAVVRGAGNLDPAITPPFVRAYVAAMAPAGPV